jgi:hypothetical protein
VSVRFIRFTLLYKKCFEYILPDEAMEWNIQQIRPIL